MMMVMTNTGKRFQIENSAEGFFDKESQEICLLIKVINASLAEVSSVFSNPLATKTLMVSTIDDEGLENSYITHYNFTVVDYIRQKLDGGVLIRLKRPEV